MEHPLPPVIEPECAEEMEAYMCLISHMNNKIMKMRNEKARKSAAASTASSTAASLAASPAASTHETEPGSSDSEDDFAAAKRPRRVKTNKTDKATTLETSNMFAALSDMEAESEQMLTEQESSPRRRKCVKSKETTATTSTANNRAPTTSAPRPPTPGSSATRSKTATAATGTKATDRLSKPAKMPAIVIHNKSAWTSISSVMTANGIKFTEAVNKFDGIHVTTTEPDDHRNLHKLLTNRKYEHHVYKLQSDKPLRVVIRGLPTDITCEEIKEELLALGFPVQEVTKLKTGREVRRESPLAYVLLQRNNAGMGIYNLTRLCYLRVTVEAKRKQENVVRQCFNCQLFGHTQSSCFAIPKCNRCAGDHDKDQCTLPREQETCMNCRRAGHVGNHAASYEGCPFHPKQRQSRVPHVRSTPSGQQANPWCTPGHNRNPKQANQEPTPGPSTQPQAAPNPERKPGKSKPEPANKSPILEIINMFASSWWEKICQFLKEIFTATSPAEAILKIVQKATTLLAHVK